MIQVKRYWGSNPATATFDKCTGVTRQEIYLDQTPTQGEPWSLDKLTKFIHIPVVFDMLTCKDGLANIDDMTEEHSAY